MKKYILLLLCFNVIIFGLCYEENYYLKIDCNSQNEIKQLIEILKDHSWFKKEKLKTHNTTIQLGPYNLQEAKDIQSILCVELDIPAYIESKENEITEEFQQQEEFCIVETSYTKYVSEDLLNYYQDENVRKIISYALELYTSPYKWGGTDIQKGIDCSYFVKYIFSRIGINLPRTSKEQFKIGKEVSKEEIKCGDLVFFKKVRYAKVKGKIKKYEYINHVGIYLKDGEFIHAARGCKRVTISSLSEPYYKKHFAGARRIVVE
ncbi:MAG: C40 family peptidase [Endomicrobiia bacterium]